VITGSFSAAFLDRAVVFFAMVVRAFPNLVRRGFSLVPVRERPRY
jgi:hypothetical protein